MSKDAPAVKLLQLLRAAYGARLDRVVGTTTPEKKAALALWEKAIEPFPWALVERARMRLPLEYPDEAPTHTVFAELCERLMREEQAARQRERLVRQAEIQREIGHAHVEQTSKVLDEYRVMKRGSREVATKSLGALLGALRGGSQEDRPDPE